MAPLSDCNIAFHLELFYLVFFHVDQRVSVVSEKMLREKDKLDVEDSCHVRVGKKEYDGRVVARGKLLNYDLQYIILGYK